MKQLFLQLSIVCKLISLPSFVSHFIIKFITCPSPVSRIFSWLRELRSFSFHKAQKLANLAGGGEGAGWEGKIQPEIQRRFRLIARNFDKEESFV